METTDLDILETELLPMAMEAVRREGFFRPFGGHIEADGEFSLGTADGNNIDEALLMLMDGMKMAAQQGRIRAAGVCYCWENPEAKSSSEVTQIALILETTAGIIRYVRVPFQKRLFRGFVFGEKSVETRVGKQIFAEESEINA